MTNHTVPPVPTKVRATYENHGVNVDAVTAQATADQQAGITINAGRTAHPGRASVLYMEAWLASMKVNGVPARFAR